MQNDDPLVYLPYTRLYYKDLYMSMAFGPKDYAISGCWAIQFRAFLGKGLHQGLVFSGPVQGPEGVALRCWMRRHMAQGFRPGSWKRAGA